MRTIRLLPAEVQLPGTAVVLWMGPFRTFTRERERKGILVGYDSVPWTRSPLRGRHLLLPIIMLTNGRLLTGHECRWKRDRWVVG